MGTAAALRHAAPAHSLASTATTPASTFLLRTPSAAHRRAGHPLPTPARSFHSTRPTSAPEPKKRDYYEVLGVPRTAEKADVKKAFYKLAKQFHPDTNKAADAASKFAEINNAYEVLSDETKRKRYDMMGHDAEQMGGPGGPGGPGGMGGMNPEDVLRDFFGMGGGGFGMGGGGGGFGGFGGGQEGPTRGADIETTLHVSFMEAVQGTTKQLNVMTDVACTVCAGTGAQPKATVSTCTDCGGKGSRRVIQGPFQVQMACGGCGGTGKKKPPCTTCHGDGVVKQRRQVDITVPAGADSQTVLRMNSAGDAGRMNGPKGHIFVKIEVGSHPHFKRDGFDIHVEAPITMAQAALGTSVPVPTLTGEVSLKVAAGTQPGEKRIMRGKGVKMLNRSGHGDQYVHFKVHVPTKLTKRSRELLEQYARENLEQVNWMTAPMPDPAAPTPAATPGAATPTPEGAATAEDASPAADTKATPTEDTPASTKKEKKGKGSILGKLFK